MKAPKTKSFFINFFCTFFFFCFLSFFWIYFFVEGNEKDIMYPYAFILSLVEALIFSSLLLLASFLKRKNINLLTHKFLFLVLLLSIFLTENILKFASFLRNYVLVYVNTFLPRDIESVSIPLALLLFYFLILAPFTFFFKKKND